MTDAGPTTLDAPLIAAARRGDLGAFNQLVERYERAVYAVCFRLLGDAHLAEDVTQDTFLRAYSALDQFEGGAFRPWLLRIATNRSYDVLRYRRRRPAESLDAQLVEEEPSWVASQGSEGDPERQAINQDLRRRLEAALGRLPEDQRVVVLLHDVEGYRYDEVAEIVGASLGTVKSRLSRARARLRDLLRDDAGSRELLEAVRRQLNSDESA